MKCGFCNKQILNGVKLMDGRTIAPLSEIVRVHNQTLIIACCPSCDAVLGTFSVQSS